MAKLVVLQLQQYQEVNNMVSEVQFSFDALSFLEEALPKLKAPKPTESLVTRKAPTVDPNQEEDENQTMKREFATRLSDRYDLAKISESPKQPVVGSSVIQSYLDSVEQYNRDEKMRSSVDRALAEAMQPKIGESPSRFSPAPDQQSQPSMDARSNELLEKPLQEDDSIEIVDAPDAQKVMPTPPEVKEEGLMSRPVDEEIDYSEAGIKKIAQQEGFSGSELAAFMAQAKHESGNFLYTSELGNKDYFKRYEPTTNIGKSLGNTEKGDGYKYRGRGYLQITGKNNYKEIGEMMGLDLVNNPELLENPAIGMKASVMWWKKNVRARMGDSAFTDTKAVSGLVNRGSKNKVAKDLEVRQDYFNDYYNVGRVKPKARPNIQVASN